MGKLEEHMTKEEPTPNVGGRPILYHVSLSKEERERLEALVRQTTAPQAQVRRAKIALLADEGMGTNAIAETLSLSGRRVSRIVSRFRGELGW